MADDRKPSVLDWLNSPDPDSRYGETVAQATGDWDEMLSFNKESTLDWAAAVEQLVHAADESLRVRASQFWCGSRRTVVA